MRILVIFAHPFEKSFLAAVRTRVVDILSLRQHKIDNLDAEALILISPI